jgi:cell division protein ZapA
MAHVSVTIAGRAYRMACDEGQEDHLLALGQLLDGKIDELRGAFGEIGDMRLVVMAGIAIADELSETQRRLVASEHLAQSLADDRAGLLARDEQAAARFASILSETAQRLDRLAEALHRAGD